MVNTINHLCYLVRSTENELNEIIKRSDCYYDPFSLPKKKYGEVQIDNNNNIKFRSLYDIIYPLKRIQEAIHHKMLQKLYVPSYAYGSVKGKNNILNAKFHVGSKYFLSIDLKDFFPSITNCQVYQMFRQYSFSPTVSRILTQLTTYKGSLPQGAPTSPMISNLVFVDTGERLQELVNPFGIKFTTFLDDLTFSSKKDFKELVPSILQIIRSYKFYPHHKKIKYCTSFPEVSGLVVDKNRLLMVDAMKKRMLKNPNLTGYSYSIEKANKELRKAKL